MPESNEQRIRIAGIGFGRQDQRTAALDSALGAALDDAGIGRIDIASGDTAPGVAVVLSGTDPDTARRVAERHGFAGPAETCPEGPAAALLRARVLLSDQTIEAVLVGESGPGETAALVLTPIRSGAADQRYATIDVIAHGEGAVAASESASAALDRAGIAPERVGYLAFADLDAAGLAAIAPVGVYRGPAQTTVIGAASRTVLGALGTAARCLYDAEFPPTPQGFSLDEDTVAQSTLCRIEDAQPWLPNNETGPRRYAAVHAVTAGAAVHAVLSGSVARGHDIPLAWAAGGGPLLLRLSADTGPDLAEAARDCLAELAIGADPAEICAARAISARPGHYTAVLVGSDGARLRKELQAAARDLPDVIAAQGEWATPSGSYCTGKPLGPDGGVAFVYPGVFSTYPGIGRDLFRLFPGLWTELDSGEFTMPLRQEFLYPRSVTGLDRRGLMRHEATILQDMPGLLTAGVTFGLLHTRLLRDILEVPVHGGLGYSLGQSSMLFALGVWDYRHHDEAALDRAGIFTRRLAGRKDVVRQVWQLSDDIDDAAVWTTLVVLADADAVRAAVGEFDRVYLTQVNAPREVVIAGDPAQCRALAERLGCPSAKGPTAVAMHCAMVDSEFSSMVELNMHPILDQGSDLVLLTTFDYDRVDASDQRQLAEHTAQALSRSVDFPRLVHAAYDRGFRYFIDVGPGASCTRWIDDTLTDADHLAVSIDRRGMPFGTALAHALARLASHGLPLDLGRLCAPAEGPEPVHVTIRPGSGATQTQPGTGEAITFEGEPFLYPMPIPAYAPTSGNGAATAHGPTSGSPLTLGHSPTPAPVHPVGTLTPGRIEVATVDGAPPSSRRPPGPTRSLDRSDSVDETAARMDSGLRRNDEVVASSGALGSDEVVASSRVLGNDRVVASSSARRNFGGVADAVAAESITQIAAATAQAHRALVSAHSAIQERALHDLESASTAGQADEAPRRSYARRAWSKPWFKPLARTSRTGLSATDIELLVEGQLGAVFGAAWDQRADGCNPSIRLAYGGTRMLDEVTMIDRLGGRVGLGALTAARSCGPALSDSLLIEGAIQLLQVYAMYLGLHLVFPDAQFQQPADRTDEVIRYRHLTPDVGDIQFHAEILDITLLPRPTVVADVTVYAGDHSLIALHDLALEVRETPGTPISPGPGGSIQFLGRRNHSGEISIGTELNIAHAGTGDLAIALGPEFAIYNGRQAPHIPIGDYQFVDRIQRLKGIRGKLAPGAEMATEYDSAPESWYYRDNSFPGMPNCVYLETSLQAAILLGYHIGATLSVPDTDFAIRNLDGTATVLRPVDLRGKTIRHESVLQMHQAIPGAILERFSYRLYADGEPFYEGESLFGFFTEQALSQQIGLDAGRYRPPWLAERDGGLDSIASLPVSADDRWFHPQPGTGLRLADGHLRLIDEAKVLPGGGQFGQGYVWASRVIDPDDWYFHCHFPGDPVMPGSLGVEAVIQALQLYVIESGLADDLGPVTFEMPVGIPTGWRYRGQILRHDREMTLDASIKEVRREPGRIVVIADASVWKPGLRIYQLTDIAVEVRTQGDPR